jgi:hypothetical protein
LHCKYNANSIKAVKNHFLNHGWTWGSIAATKSQKAIHHGGAENAEKTMAYTQNLVRKTRKCGIVVQMDSDKNNSSWFYHLARSSER